MNLISFFFSDTRIWFIINDKLDRKIQEQWKQRYAAVQLLDEQMPTQVHKNGLQS